MFKNSLKMVMLGLFFATATTATSLLPTYSSAFLENKASFLKVPSTSFLAPVPKFILHPGLFVQKHPLITLGLTGLTGLVAYGALAYKILDRYYGQPQPKNSKQSNDTTCKTFFGKFKTMPTLNKMRALLLSPLIFGYSFIHPETWREFAESLDLIHPSQVQQKEIKKEEEKIEKQKIDEKKIEQKEEKKIEKKIEQEQKSEEEKKKIEEEKKIELEKQKKIEEEKKKKELEEIEKTQKQILKFAAEQEKQRKKEQEEINKKLKQPEEEKKLEEEKKIEKTPPPVTTATGILPKSEEKKEAIEPSKGEAISLFEFNKLTQNISAENLNKITEIIKTTNSDDLFKIFSGKKNEKNASTLYRLLVAKGTKFDSSNPVINDSDIFEKYAYYPHEENLKNAHINFRKAIFEKLIDKPDLLTLRDKNDKTYTMSLLEIILNNAKLSTLKLYLDQPKNQCLENLYDIKTKTLQLNLKKFFSEKTIVFTEDFKDNNVLNYLTPSEHVQQIGYLPCFITLLNYIKTNKSVDNLSDINIKSKNFTCPIIAALLYKIDLATNQDTFFFRYLAELILEILIQDNNQDIPIKLIAPQENLNFSKEFYDALSESLKNLKTYIETTYSKPSNQKLLDKIQRYEKYKKEFEDAQKYLINADNNKINIGNYDTLPFSDNTLKNHLDRLKDNTEPDVDDNLIIGKKKDAYKLNDSFKKINVPQTITETSTTYNITKENYDFYNNKFLEQIKTDVTTLTNKYMKLYADEINKLKNRAEHNIKFIQDRKNLIDEKNIKQTIESMIKKVKKIKQDIETGKTEEKTEKIEPEKIKQLMVDGKVDAIEKLYEQNAEKLKILFTRPTPGTSTFLPPLSQTAFEFLCDALLSTDKLDSIQNIDAVRTVMNNERCSINIQKGSSEQKLALLTFITKKIKINITKLNWYTADRLNFLSNMVNNIKKERDEKTDNFKKFKKYDIVKEFKIDLDDSNWYLDKKLDLYNFVTEASKKKLLFADYDYKNNDAENIKNLFSMALEAQNPSLIELLLKNYESTFLSGLPTLKIDLEGIFKYKILHLYLKEDYLTSKEKITVLFETKDNDTDRIVPAVGPFPCFNLLINHLKKQNLAEIQVPISKNVNCSLAAGLLYILGSMPNNDDLTKLLYSGICEIILKIYNESNALDTEQPKTLGTVFKFNKTDKKAKTKDIESQIKSGLKNLKIYLTGKDKQGKTTKSFSPKPLADETDNKTLLDEIDMLLKPEKKKEEKAIEEKKIEKKKPDIEKKKGKKLREEGEKKEIKKKKIKDLKKEIYANL